MTGLSTSPRPMKRTGYQRPLEQRRRLLSKHRVSRTGVSPRARGEADGFNAILLGYQDSPEVTRRRLYLEAMEQILPGIKKFVLSDQGVLPFLPLDGTTTPSSPAAAGDSAGGQP